MAERSMARPLLITLEYPPQRGGVATYLAGEVEKSAEPVRVVLAQKYFWDKWPAWLPLLWSIVPPPLLRRGQGGGRPDYVWISHVLPIGYAALVWKAVFGIPYRAYAHGLDLVLPRQSVWKGFWVRRILLAADEIVANSKATAELLDYYNIPASRARISYPKILPPPPPPLGQGGRAGWREYYATAGHALRKKYNLVNKPILLTISRLVKRKGINLVIRALSAVWKSAPDLTYVVVGEGDEAHELKSLAGNNPRVIFTGPVSEEEKYAWLSACDCFILTPVDDPNDFEGYGIVYKEAQLFGKPVIGSKVGGVPEAVGDGGVLVEAGNIPQIAEAIVRTIDI